jgi:hypothetical protein
MEKMYFSSKLYGMLVLYLNVFQVAFMKQGSCFFKAKT